MSARNRDGVRGTSFPRLSRVAARVRIELVPGPGDAHVAEPPLLLEVLGLALHARRAGRRSSSMPIRKTSRYSRPLAPWSVIRVTRAGPGPSSSSAGVERQAVQVGEQVRPPWALALLEAAPASRGRCSTAGSFRSAAAAEAGAGARRLLEADLLEQAAGSRAARLPAARSSRRGSASISAENSTTLSPRPGGQVLGTAPRRSSASQSGQSALAGVRRPAAPSSRRRCPGRAR